MREQSGSGDSYSQLTARLELHRQRFRLAERGRFSVEELIGELHQKGRDIVQPDEATEWLANKQVLAYSSGGGFGMFYRKKGQDLYTVSFTTEPHDWPNPIRDARIRYAVSFQEDVDAGASSRHSASVAIRILGGGDNKGYHWWSYLSEEGRDRLQFVPETSGVIWGGHDFKRGVEPLYAVDPALVPTVLSWEEVGERFSHFAEKRIAWAEVSELLASPTAAGHVDPFLPEGA
ncbi:MAG: hypothetical protein A2900_05220 [Candidatus Chisholmbacteria bacterium RIFCSPLOWO2_01_FULL_50_28]|uniref:Uncharacterized protein n=1 Tax=Candidatus Chisholmbacteria bacterium RIFCSPHIGHO2_01_FULL_52_32 TaxID=1797591 RepID=A0A1G1VRZ8_9BACT|nr:MAG: hypothetical protein A2786_01525 [Candidatus Chisholmbacteria bacterium RIFCSPHIGHO2_01_FULL_52_32]OGY20449.1 MAG: hypothetical protein A2900_05220 [Candidatus Chisholmbacteria bacterium RIFCSPLOWO2_01_FULL_50_28]